MQRALTFRPALFFVFILASAISAISQTVSYQTPNEFFVCGTAPFQVTVNNTGNATIQDVKIKVTFTTSTGNACGVAYAAGSVSGAQEDDISNLSMPVFKIADLAAGGAVTFTLQAEAPCPVAACIDNAEFFINQMQLTWTGGSSTVTTTPYVIERPLLVITSVMNTVMSGQKGDILQRKITVRNTRPGALQSFIFTDVHQPGISISSAIGTNISPAPDTFRLQVGGADFAAIGDGDQLFELNETIVITENILITDCGVDITSAVSNITAGWGCEANQICQQSFINAIVTIQPTTKVPNLFWQPITEVPECFCGPEAKRQGMKITNTGNGPATDITLNIVQPLFPLGGFIDTSSIWMDSAGMQLNPAASFFGLSNLQPPCVGPPGVANSMNVLIPLLAPGASVTVYWDLYFCEQGCLQPTVRWRYRYSYYKPCPPDPFIQSGGFINVNAEGLKMVGTTSMNPGGPFQDDSLYTVTYQVKYDSLNILDDIMTVEFILPCGMIWDDSNELLLNGQAPSSISTTVTDTFHTVTATYQLPLAINTGTINFNFTFDCESLCLPQQVCIDSIETTCPTPVCGGGGLPDIAGSIKTSILKCSAFPAGCNIQACSSFGAFYDCPIDSICITRPPGYVAFKLDAVRKNYGLPDNNNDQVADGTGLPNLNLVRKDRLIAGDTIHATLRGMVVIDSAGVVMPYARAAIRFTGQPNMTQLNSIPLMTEQGILPAGAKLRVFDSSAGVWYECNDIVPAVDAMTGVITYIYDLSVPALSGCGLPPGFVYDHGDSIIVDANYRIGYNLIREGDFDPLRGNLALTPEFVVSPEKFEDSPDPLNCHCGGSGFELSGYEYVIVPGIYALPPCSNSQFVGGSLFRLELHEGNFFPFEYRNVLKALDWQLQIPATVSIVESRMTFLLRQGGAIVASNQTLTPVFANGIYTCDFGQFQNPPVEEGFSALFQYRFSSDCKNTGSLPVVFTTHLDFAPGLPQPLDPLEFKLQANVLRALTPNLLISAPLFDLVSFNNQLVLDFTLANFPTVVASQSSGPALNTWLYVTSPTGLVTDFQLIDQTTGQPVPSVNGIFQFGNFPIDTLPFQLIATNNSCNQEHLQIHFGWNCTPFTSPIQTPCNEQIKPLTIISPPGEIDFFVNSPPGCTDLCDTIPYHTIEIFNAQLGAVYNLTLTALMPPGLLVLPGSCEIEFPTGSGNYFPIGDPVLLNNSVVRWHLAELLDTLASGLAGVSSAPANSFTLRFLSSTTCDLVASSFVLFVVAAEQNCGTLTNTVAKPGDPVCINGLTSPYFTNINATPTPGFSCNDEVDFEVTMTSSATLPEGACIIVTLPPGIVYQPGSCSSVCQANFNCNPTVQGGQLVWQLPPGVPSNQLVCFKFKTTGWSEQGCENGVLLFRTANETEAFCAATGDTCSTKVGTGALILPYKPFRPSFDLSNFMVNATQTGGTDEVFYSIDITNTGAPSLPPLITGFYLDTDGNGSGDLLVYQHSLSESIGTNETETLTGSFSIPSGNLCNLIAYIDPDAHCACAGDSAKVTFPVTYTTNQTAVVCSGQNLQMGVPPMPGFTYQWTPVGCLSPANAATTTFNCLNTTPNPVTYLFTLKESNNGGCVLNRDMTITLQPVPGIVFAETPICAGATANLAASQGVSFNWQGPGIANPALQVQVVQPATTSLYIVTVEDDEGCIGTDSVTVVVNPMPLANAGPDTTFCPGGNAKLNATVTPGNSYLWSPANALSNPAIPNPSVLTNQTTTFTLTVTSPLGCKSTDQVTINFAATPQLAVSPNVTVCLGSSATLQASGAGSYQWSPAGTCQNAQCSAISVSPAATTTYTVTGTNAAGCTASSGVTVTVTTESINTTGPPVQICEGETAILFGQPVSQAGVYCDTFLIAGGCDSIHCIQLLVNPVVDTAFFAETICKGSSAVFQGQTFTQAGTHCINFTAQNGCDSTLCLNLSVLDTPQVSLIVPDTVFIGDAIELSIEPSAFDSILWFGGNITGLCTNSPVCMDSITEVGNVDYSVTVTNDEGCSGIAQRSVFVTFDCQPQKAVIPNVFTPNQDGLNDVFDIVSPGEELILSMKIWNRFGQLVYEGPGPWDGSQKNEPAAVDVYIYLIRVGCPAEVEADERVLKGDVTLLR